MKIKTSQKLDQMMQELYDQELYGVDFDWIDDLLIRFADYYTIEDKNQSEEHVAAGVALCLLSQKKNKPIYEVHSDGFSVYFVAELNEIKTILTKQLKTSRRD